MIITIIITTRRTKPVGDCSPLLAALKTSEASSEDVTCRITPLDFTAVHKDWTRSDGVRRGDKINLQ